MPAEDARAMATHLDLASFAKVILLESADTLPTHYGRPVADAERKPRRNVSARAAATDGACASAERAHPPPRAEPVHERRRRLVRERDHDQRPRDVERDAAHVDDEQQRQPGDDRAGAEEELPCAPAAGCAGTVARSFSDAGGRI